MISRIHIKCATCGESVAVRTSIGHGDYQEFAFPCPKCGIEIRYGMDIDQVKAGLRYSKMVNAEFGDSSPTPPTALSFHPELLVPCQTTPEFEEIYSPFLVTSSLVPDVQAFLRRFRHRLTLITERWPILRNCIVHFKSGNWDLYRQEAKALGTDLGPLDKPQLIAHCLSEIHEFSEPFRPHLGHLSSLVRQRINLAETSASTCCQDLRNYLEGIGWINLLFDELCSLRDRWARIYLIIQPVFIVNEWDAASNHLTDYTLSQKRFDDIKPFYIDAFETLCRLSVIAGGIEGIISATCLVVPTSSGNIPLDEYRGMTNGRKKDIVDSWPVADVFKAMADNQLRNGVGHHAAKHDIAADEIQYRIENRSGVSSQSIKYVLFCEKILNLYGMLETASIYLHWAMARKLGITGKVV